MFYYLLKIGVILYGPPSAPHPTPPKTTHKEKKNTPPPTSPPPHTQKKKTNGYRNECKELSFLGILDSFVKL